VVVILGRIFLLTLRGSRKKNQSEKESLREEPEVSPRH
jgi:hypothetical protein